MKKMLAVLFTAAFAFIAFSANASADCKSEMAAASKSAAKDKQCQKGAKSLGKKFAKQLSICKAYRKILKGCRKAKRAEKKECRQEKKACKKGCKGLKGKAKRKCKKACRAAKKKCKKSARDTKKACKKEAKTTKAWAVCKDARKMTRKAAGALFKCAWKHYRKAAGVCAKELVASLGK